MNHAFMKSNRRLTYAQWITKAIASSPIKAITLADINEWMIANVPGLQDQRYLHSCKGWKNAVRHTLSINRHRFKKVPRDGKPSLWSLTDVEALTIASNDEHIKDQALQFADNNIERTMSIIQSTKDHQEVQKTRISSTMNGDSAELRKSCSPTEYKPEIDKSGDCNKTQCLEVIYADGIVGKLVLPSPLPISDLNFGGLLFNSVITPNSKSSPISIVPHQQPQQQQRYWPPLSTFPNMNFANQMLYNNNQLVWDLLKMSDVLKSEKFA